MDIQGKIASRIKEIRLSKNLTQEEVAWRADIDRTFMNHIENARRNISIKSLEKIIINGLETSFKEFFSSKDFA